MTFMDSKSQKSGSITNEFLRNLHFSGLKGKANFSSTTPQILTSKMKAYALIEENLELNCGVQDQVVDYVVDMINELVAFNVV